MMMRRVLLTSRAIGLAATSSRLWPAAPLRAAETFEVTHSDDEWRKLSSSQPPERKV
jgi:hypothetical protein